MAVKKVREGYKITELGEIPEEWKVKRIGDVAKINPKKEIIADDKDVSFIAMEDVSSEGRIVRSNTRKYREVKKGYTGFKNNDVLLAKITPCFENGKRALVTQLVNGIGFGSTEFHVLRANENYIIPIYVYYTISTNKFVQQAQANMTGSAGQKRVPTEFLKEYVIAIPSIYEQQKISSIVSVVDEQIEITDNLIEKTKKLKKGLMQKLLTEGIGHSRFKETEIGRIPEEWEVKSIEEVCNIVDYRGKTPIKVEEGVFLVTAKNIGKGFIDYNVSKEYIREQDYNNVMSRGLPKNGDVLFTTEAPLGNVANVNREDIALAQRVIKLRGTSEILNNYYLKYYMLSERFQKSIYDESTGSTVLGIKGSRLKKIKILIPTLKEQAQLALILSSVDEQIDQYESKKEKLQELKKGLMQKLLTGRIRVKVN